MANHKSALKRVRQSAKRRVHNAYYHKTTRNAIRRLRLNTDKKDATEKLPSVISMIDKLAKMVVAELRLETRLKSSLTKHVSSL